MRALWLAPALALALAGCSSGDPQDELRADVEAVTRAANDGSAQGVRDAVEELLATIRSQVASRDLDRAEGDRLREIALRIEQEAALLEDAPPSPVPTVEEQEPEPEVTEEEEPEPEPTEEEPEPEPTQEEPEPEPTQEEPEPEQTVEVEVPVEESPPSTQSQGAAGSSAEPSPAA